MQLFDDDNAFKALRTTEGINSNYRVSSYEHKRSVHEGTRYRNLINMAGLAQEVIIMHVGSGPQKASLSISCIIGGGLLLMISIWSGNIEVRRAECFGLTARNSWLQQAGLAMRHETHRPRYWPRSFTLKTSHSQIQTTLTPSLIPPGLANSSS